jgi:peroxiredoxin
MALVHTPPVDGSVTAPDFALPDPAGRVHTLAQCRGARGTLVAFICNHCPYVQRIAAGLAADARALLDAGIGVVAVMPNDYRAYPDDAPEHMAAFAQQHGFAFPYLVDEAQEVARAYGAVCTPDFFGFDAAGRLVWRGNAAELRGAMEALAATGQAPAQQTPSMGCSIKWRGA